MGPRRIGSTCLGEGRFLRLDLIEYEDPHGRLRRWEAAARQGGAAAVLMIPLLHPSDRYVLIRQYRPPVDGLVLEFPAGLVDAAESPVAAAMRELLEETGYLGTVRWICPHTASSPGMTGEGVMLALVDIDETDPANRNPTPRPEDGEHIECFLVPRGSLGEFIRAQQRDGVHIDSRTAAFALGLGQMWQQP